MDVGPCFSDEEFAADRQDGQAPGPQAHHPFALRRDGARRRARRVRLADSCLVHAHGDIGFVRDKRIPICPTLTYTAKSSNGAATPASIRTTSRPRSASWMLWRDPQPRPQGRRPAHGRLGVRLLGHAVRRMARARARADGRSSSAYADGSNRRRTQPMPRRSAGERKPARSSAGRSADILIVEGDPLADISVLGKLEAESRRCSRAESRCRPRNRVARGGACRTSAASTSQRASSTGRKRPSDGAEERRARLG